MRALCYAVPGVAKLSVLSSSIQYDKVAVKENTVYRNMGNLWKEVTDSGKVSLLFSPPACISTNFVSLSLTFCQLSRISNYYSIAPTTIANGLPEVILSYILVPIKRDVIYRQMIYPPLQGSQRFATHLDTTFHHICTY
jgi:hypothetical protein